MSFQRWPIFLAVLLAAIGAVCPARGAEKAGLPEAALKILTGATRVECFRIDPRSSDKGEGKPDGKQLDGYPITTTGQERGADFAERLAAALKDEKSYGPSARCFFPGVGFRAWKGKESVDVVICYQCSNFYLVARDANGKQVARGEMTGFQDNSAAFVKLAKDAFPDDSAIQNLDEKGSRAVGEARSGL